MSLALTIMGKNSMIIKSEFKPAWWLANPHAQTIYPTLTRRLQTPLSRMERFELPDGDFIDLAWAEYNVDANAPLVIILHGLGGSIQSKYVGGFLNAFNQRGWRAVLMHFRGASGEVNRLPRSYHSGDTDDFNCLIRTLAQREPNTKKAAVGVSLGGNVLLKWLGEQESQSWLQTAVAVSVPFQLGLAADRMNRGLSRIYQTYLLRNMRKLFKRMREQHGETMFPALNNMEAFRCFWTFDNYITAPMHGFKGVHDYYRQASSRQYLSKISTPTLIIHASDDPFMSPDILPTSEELSADVVLEVSRKGGHVGFISGSMPGKPCYWLDQRIPDHINRFF